MSTQLEAEGIELTVGYGADQTALKPDLWVVGNVVSRGNPLVEVLLDRGERYVSGPQWLAENTLLGREVLGVAGTRGKKTTSPPRTQIPVGYRAGPRLSDRRASGPIAGGHHASQ